MSSVLVLNRNFYAIAVTDWKRAIGLLYLNHAIVVDKGWRTYDFDNWLGESEQISRPPAGFVHTPTRRIAVPEVIALKVFGKVPKREVTFTRRNIYLHYGFRCCYCGAQFNPKKLNLDHVVPRSRGGKTGWSNVVASCIPCNKRKGSSLPHEVGLKVHYKPSRPKAQGGAAFFLKYRTASRRSWNSFLRNSIGRENEV